jgi:vacuolar-type H+-ATPase subunit E/Vma4
MTEPKKMTDTRLFKLARLQKEAKLAEAAAKADAQTYSDQIIPELKRRGVKALENDEGIRVNKVETPETVYDVDEMERVLGKAKFDRLTKRVPDAAAIKAALDEGALSARTLAKFATTRTKSAYIVVTIKDN